MNLLEDSPLEALTFNYFSFGLVAVINNLWTCLAVITAALSFWKIRASSVFPKSDSLLPPPQHRPHNQPDPLPEASDLDAVPQPRVVAGNGVADYVDGVTKRKFTVYYHEDAANVERDSDDDDEPLTATDEARSDGCDLSEWWENWERLLRFSVGKSESGWYTCQDLTALNGNVVRFWDGGSTRDSSLSC